MLNLCYIYRCSAKIDMYIYLAEENGFDVIDEKLLRKLGDLDYAMTIKLDENTKLAREDPKKIMASIEKQGFHLQFPSEATVEELMAKLAKKPL